MGLVGILVLLGIAFAVSTNRRAAFNLRLLGWGLGLPIVIAVLALRTPIGTRFFAAANAAADAFVGFTEAGTRFVFGDWPAVIAVGRPAPTATGAAGFEWVVVGFVFAIKVLPIIIFMASLMAMLYHLGIMQRVVAVLAKVLVRTMKHLGRRSAVDHRRRVLWA